MQTVILDLDGLIVNTEPLHRMAFNMVLETCGVDYRIGAQEYGRAFSGVPQLGNAEALRARFGLPQPVESVSQAQRALFQLLIGDARNLEPMPGLYELLDGLKAQGTRLAVASGSLAAHVEIMLRGLQIRDRFEVVVSADGTLPNKPAPDLYFKALADLGARADECVALEDSATGVQAADGAGLFVIAVPNEYTRGQSFGAADVVLDDLHRAREFLQPKASQIRIY